MRRRRRRRRNLLKRGMEASQLGGQPKLKGLKISHSERARSRASRRTRGQKRARLPNECAHGPGGMGRREEGEAPAAAAGGRAP